MNKLMKFKLKYNLINNGYKRLNNDLKRIGI